MTKPMGKCGFHTSHEANLGAGTGRLCFSAHAEEVAVWVWDSRWRDWGSAMTNFEKDPSDPSHPHHASDPSLSFHSFPFLLFGSTEVLHPKILWRSARTAARHKDKDAMLILPRVLRVWIWAVCTAIEITFWEFSRDQRQRHRTMIHLIGASSRTGQGTLASVVFAFNLTVTLNDLQSLVMTMALWLYHVGLTLVLSSEVGIKRANLTSWQFGWHGMLGHVVFQNIWPQGPRTSDLSGALMAVWCDVDVDALNGWRRWKSLQGQHYILYLTIKGKDSQMWRGHGVPPIMSFGARTRTRSFEKAALIIGEGFPRNFIPRMQKGMQVPQFVVSTFVAFHLFPDMHPGKTPTSS